MGHSTVGLRVTTSSGLSYGDPSEDLVYQLMLQVHAGEESFFIIERLADTTGQTYVQVLRDVDRTFVVEQRDGSGASHRSRAVVKMATAYSLLIDWAFHELDVMPARGR